MNEKDTNSSWNHLNIIAAFFLFLLVFFLMLFSKLQLVASSDTLHNEPITIDDLKEKEQHLIQLESDLQVREEKLSQMEKQIIERETAADTEKEELNKIVQTFVNEFSKLNQTLRVDDKTGTISVGNGILFETSKDEITIAGADYLKEFIPVYFSILLNEENRDYIAEIIIEGHGDNQGSYSSNLNLSQKRAGEVTHYIFSDDMPDFKYQDLAPSYITANGRSFCHPIIKMDGSIDKDKSRRVEFKFRLKDEKAMKEMQKIINERIDS